jgi:hypothetical protein
MSTSFSTRKILNGKLESTRILDIEKFVPRESIDRLYWDTPYHLVPSGKTGVEAGWCDEHARADLRYRDRRAAITRPRHGPATWSLLEQWKPFLI